MLIQEVLMMLVSVAMREVGQVVNGIVLMEDVQGVFRDE
jgi:hypothetical protein